MSNFTITIEAPQICEAIKIFAAALFGKQTSASAMAAPTSAAQPTAAPAPIPTPVILPPIPTAAPAPVPTAAPIYAAPAAPVYSAPAPAPAPVIPTAAAPTYTTEQLAVAATQLVDAGRRLDLVNLLKSFGVSALTQLPKEMYGAFATTLREMGVKI